MHFQKSILFLVLSSITTHLLAQVKPNEELVVVNGRAGLQEITINSEVATTITFPAAVSVVTGYGLVADFKSVVNFSPTNEVTLVHFQQVAQDTIVLRSLKDGKPCFLTARTTDQIYLFKCVPGEDANLAVIVSDEDIQNQAIEVAPEEVVEKRLEYDPMSLVGILSRAKQRKFLQTVNPALYEGWKERNNLQLQSICQEAVVTIYEVQQWPDRDALVFRCVVENPTEATLKFDPKAVQVRVGDRSYPIQLADGSGTINGNQRTALDLVLMGNSQGGKEHIAIENDFRIEIPITKSGVAAIGKDTIPLAVPDRQVGK